MVLFAASVPTPAPAPADPLPKMSPKVAFLGPPVPVPGPVSAGVLAPGPLMGVGLPPVVLCCRFLRLAFSAASLSLLFNNDVHDCTALFPC